MELIIKGKNLEVDAAAQEYIEGKLGKLERHFPDIGEVKVELTREMTKAEDNRYIAQVTINSHGTLLRGEERASTINTSIDKVLDVLTRQVERFKDKLYRSKRRVSPLRKEMANEPIIEEVKEESRIVKVKRFPVKPMTPEEAIDQMELLSHDFFIFFNPESNKFSVIYKRGDGYYGLIEPELA
ncbi:MAG: ribosomal subunit interface protein [Chloroflexi bacterium RBG_13_52_14]|nr:MAG: ribosomal subunit interface protein [Chloroflexi bacterium RBG_13_52_14]